MSRRDRDHAEIFAQRLFADDEAQLSSGFFHLVDVEHFREYVRTLTISADVIKATVLMTEDISSHTDANPVMLLHEEKCT